MRTHSPPQMSGECQNKLRSQPASDDEDEIVSHVFGRNWLPPPYLRRHSTCRPPLSHYLARTDFPTLYRLQGPMQASLAAAHLLAASYRHSPSLPPSHLLLRRLGLRASKSLSASSTPSTAPRILATRFSSRSQWRPLYPASQNAKLQAGAVSVPGSAGGEDDVVPVPAAPSAAASGGVWRNVELAVLFAAWFIFNIYFNIYNKQVLKVFPYPVTVSAFQFGLGSVLPLLLWSTGLRKKPKLSSSQLLAILPLAVLHTLGNLFTNMSLGSVNVSFTHTIKAMEPFFSVLLSAMFLGQAPTLFVLVSLVPVVGGVALASLSEVSFNWYGFWSAMASNLVNQSRNVLSKKLMDDKEDVIDNTTLFSTMTVMSFIMLVPVTLVVEGVKFTPDYVQSAGLNVRELYVRSFLAGICFQAYQQVSYGILARVSPVTHSVSNCVKRVVVIVASVLFFRTPVSLINSIGTGIALVGVFLYSRVKGIKHKAS